MLKKIYLIIIILVIISLVYFIFFNNSKENVVLDNDIILTPIDISQIDCNLSNLDKVINIQKDSFVCSLLNSKFTWIRLDSDLNNEKEEVIVNSSLEKEEISKELAKTYVYENQKCSSRNISQKAYLIDTNIEMACTENNGSYFWQIISKELGDDVSFDINADLNSDFIDDDVNYSDLNFPDDNSDDQIEEVVLDLNYENSMQDHECFFNEENNIYYDYINEVNFICVYNSINNKFNWTLLE